ncbi:MAG: hypothetical protein AB1428_09185 [Bacteroidota bacterium]
MSRSSHVSVLLESLGTSEKARRFTAARSFLRQRLVMTRDTPIGRDFLFKGDAAEIKAALRDLVDVEHGFPGGLQFDFTAFNDLFLLRIVGLPSRQGDIAAYFEGE